jgi:hypothetical protein
MIEAGVDEKSETIIRSYDGFRKELIYDLVMGIGVTSTRCRYYCIPYVLHTGTYVLLGKLDHVRAMTRGVDYVEHWSTNRTLHTRYVRVQYEIGTSVDGTNILLTRVYCTRPYDQGRMIQHYGDCFYSWNGLIRRMLTTSFTIPFWNLTVPLSFTFVIS